MQPPGDPNPRPQPTRQEASAPDRTVDESSHADHGRPSNPTFDPPAAPGEVGMLGPYQIIQELGHGGMGAVYLAVDTRLQRKVALKVMLPRFAAQRASKERFLREARAAAQISHDHVVTVYEADERRGVTYIAMQFLKGTSLEDYLHRKGNLAIGPILRVGREAAAGLAAAHRIGLVHRDIKPGNLWLEAPHGRVKVLDFGLAKPLDSDIELTTSGMVVGTPVYMSPEQARGHQVDARSDLFSLGAVLYRLCSGQLPFAGDTTMAILMALGTEEPKPLLSLNPEVPASLAELIHRMLQKDPALRPQTADDVARRLRAIGEEFIAPRASALTTSAPTAPDPQDIDITAVGSGTSGQQFMNSVVHKTLPKKALWAAGVLAVVIIGGMAFFAWDSDRQLAKTRASEDTAMPGAAGLTSAEKNEAPPPEVDAAAVPQASTKLLASSNPQPTTKPALPAPTTQPQPPADGLADANRSGANWVLEHAGRVQFNGAGETTSPADLPSDAFTVTRVHLHQEGITNDAMARLGALTALTMIDLGRVKISDAGLEHFKELKRLATLSLRNTAVTGTGMQSLKDLNSLLFLDLAGCATDAGLGGAAQCTSLRYLCLSDAPISDAGLAALKGLPNLLRLDLRRTHVTDAGVADFHAALPNCKVQYNGGVIEPGLAPDHSAEQLGIVELLTSPDYTWSMPRALDNDLQLHSEVSDPVVAGEGLTLWFAARENKDVEMDIWSSHRKSIDAPWEPAVNAGPPVNTAARETMPQLSADVLAQRAKRAVQNLPDHAIFPHGAVVGPDRGERIAIRYGRHSVGRRAGDVHRPRWKN